MPAAAVNQATHVPSTAVNQATHVPATAVNQADTTISDTLFCAVFSCSMCVCPCAIDPVSILVMTSFTLR